VTPTQRSLAYLRAEGWQVAIVERWNPHARIRQDLFGVFDLLAVRDETTMGVQVTSTGVASRVKKIADSDMVPALRRAGWSIMVHGWRKSAKGRYVLREVDCS
jgi:hypothetical protein